MTNEAATGEVAIRHLRMLLIKQGLTEDEADAFIGHLSKEFRSGGIYSEASIRASVDAYIATLSTRRTVPARLKEALWTLVLGAAGSALWDFLKAEVERQLEPQKPKFAPQRGVEVPEKWNGEILIEWGFQPIGAPAPGEEDYLRRALTLRESRYGQFHQKTAVSLDALGFCLDAKGEHRQAAGYRATALKASQRASGPKSISTAAALSNLGLCMAHQKQYSDAEKFLRRGYDLMRRSCGPRHIWTAVAVFNLFYCMKAQGRFLATGYSQQFKALEPDLQKAFAEMTAWKRINIAIDALREIMDHLKVWLNQQGQ